MHHLRRLRPPPFRLLVLRTPPPSRRHHSTKPTQAFPLTGFYLELLTHPLTPANPSPPSTPGTPGTPGTIGTTGTTTTTAAVAATTPTVELSPTERARIVFGTRLAGPGSVEENERFKREKGQMIAGVWVPPRPVEPDNCCMSGCVNCVLSTFVEDLNEWRVAKRRAEKLQSVGKKEKKKEGEGGMWEGFEDIPVGLRVFMETEKRLKERKA